MTPAYLEPWHIQNTAKHLSRNILFKTLCNPGIFRNLVYSELWYILKSKYIQNPAEYLRGVFYKEPCAIIADLEALYIQNLRIFTTGVCQLLLNVSSIF